MKARKIFWYKQLIYTQKIPNLLVYPMAHNSSLDTGLQDWAKKCIWIFNDRWLNFDRFVHVSEVIYSSHRNRHFCQYFNLAPSNLFLDVSLQSYLEITRGYLVQDDQTKTGNIVDEKYVWEQSSFNKKKKKAGLTTVRLGQSTSV